MDKFLFSSHIKIEEKGVKIMEDINVKAIVGETFEDMSVSEMTKVQGSGDVDMDSMGGSYIQISKIWPVPITLQTIMGC